MVQPVGSMPGPEDPYYSGLDANEPAEITGAGAKLRRETQEAHCAQTPNRATFDSPADLIGDWAASWTNMISYGTKPGGVPRATSYTHIPKGVEPGTIDESGSKSPFRKDVEVPIVKKLAKEGYDVKKLPDGDGKGKKRPADAILSGNGLAEPKRVELKAMRPKEGEVSGRNTIRNQVSHSIEGEGQARHMILDGRGSGLTEEEARKGIDKIVPRGKLDSVRVVGDEFDLTAEFLDNQQGKGKVR